MNLRINLSGDHYANIENTEPLPVRMDGEVVSKVTQIKDGIAELTIESEEHIEKIMNTLESGIDGVVTSRKDMTVDLPIHKNGDNDLSK